MTIKSSAAAIVAAFSVVLFFAPSAQAQERPEPKSNNNQPVIVEIKTGDTLSSIADVHSTTYVRIFNANETIANPDTINAGDKVRIPTRDETLPDRYASFNTPPLAPAVGATSSTTAQSTITQSTPQRTFSATNSGNTYYRGYCTWYAKERRPDLPNMLGNGGQWVANAAARGYATGSTPRAGAIAEIPGHVAYVEAVNGDGTMVISEMNGPAGFGVVGTRTVPANQYRFIY